MVLSSFVTRKLSLSLLVLATGVVSSQDYPSKPIRIITAGAGGGVDFTARLIAQSISGPIGQQVIVENRTGILASEAVSKAPPDGYTLLVNGSSHWVRFLLAKMPYDPVKDFAPISLVSRDIYVLAVHPSLPVKSTKELIALAKARPGALNYAAGTPGGGTHLAGELFKSMAGVNIVAVAYKGPAQSLIALAAGEVQVGFVTAASGPLVPHLKSGRLRPLAVTSAEPSALAPGLPTIAASGVPGYESVGISGIWAPAKTPATIINRLHQEIVRALTLPEVKERLLNADVEAVGSSPEQFAAMIKSDMVNMAKVIKDAGLKLE